MNRKIITAALSLAMTFSFSVPAFAVDTASAPEYGPNAKAAMSEFGIGENNVEIVSEKENADAINKIMQRVAVAYDASENAPIMVYVPDGTRSVGKTLKVPENVVLVSEDSVVYEASSSVNMLQVSGSVYGGVFDKKSNGGNIANYDILTFKGSNGIIEKTTMKNSKLTGIQINGAAKNAKVINNIITNCKKNGISSYRNGHFALIEGNKISKIGSKGGGSGIDITQSDAAVIKNNKIKNVIGHGISTDTETHKDQKKSVNLGEVSGNKISKTGHHGIWLEKGAKITKCLNANKISNAVSNCVGIDKNASIKIMNSNTLQGAKHALLLSSASGSKVTIGSKNTFKSGKAAGIAIGKKGTVKITGAGNLITKNKKNGIQLDKNAILTISGKTTITGNRWGINMCAKSKATIKNCIIKGNKKGAIYYLKGAKLKKSKCKIKGKVYKQK